MISTTGDPIPQYTRLGDPCGSAVLPYRAPPMPPSQWYPLVEQKPDPSLDLLMSLTTMVADIIARLAVIEKLLKEQPPLRAPICPDEEQMLKDDKAFEEQQQGEEIMRAIRGVCR